MTHSRLFAAFAVLPLAACGPQDGTVDVQQPLPEAEVVTTHPADEFMDNLRAHCGNAYRGELVEFNEGDADMVGQEMVMHVRECFEDEIRIPFHIGDDRSRTWIYTRTADGLRLKHDHRMPDGSEDEVTQYGGDTVVDGEGNEQAFHADRYTGELLPASANNIWTVRVIPGELYSYRLRRTDEVLEPRAEGEAPASDARMFRLNVDGRRFRVDFDLTEAVEPPPAPWGYED